MNAYDLYLISPQLSMAGLGILIIILDLVFSRRSLLPIVAFFGLLVPLAFSLLQIADLLGLFGSPGANNLVPPNSVLAGSLAVDRFSLFFNFLVLAAAGLVVLSSVDYVGRMDRHRAEYFGLILISATGMMLMVGASELITIYISLELTTMPLAALAALLLTTKSSEAGMKFLIVGALSSAIMLYGMAIIYGFTGSTTLEGISQGFSSSHQQNFPFGSHALLVGVILLLVGFGFKLSIVPFQMWVPDVYEGAPTPVVAFLSVASKAAAFALVLRVLYSGFLDISPDWAILMSVLAAASMTVGNLAAMVQTNLKRLLGYSTIAHAGYILIGVAAITKGGDFSNLGPSSVLFYLVAYAAANLTAFFAIMAIGHRIDSDEIDDYSGMVRRSPFLAVALSLSLVALIGVPPTSIFIAKIYIFTAAVNSGLTWLAIIGVVNSVVSAYYYVHIIRVMFLEPPQSDGAIDASPVSKFSLAVAAVAIVWIGVAPGMVLSAAEGAARVLHGIGS